MPRKKKEGVEKVDSVVDDRGEILKTLMKQAQKSYGKGAMGFASDFLYKDDHRITTGILSLDRALGGGLPVGRISMIYGPRSSSKTTTFLRSVGRSQRMCSRCWTQAFPLWTPHYDQLEPACACGEYRKTVAAWLDVEGVWDELWSKRFLNIEELILARPDAGEETVDIADSLLRSSAVDIICIDSIAFMTPLAEIERSAADKGMGEQARLVGSMMRKFVSGVNKISNQEGRRPTIWFTNQIRQKTGVVFGNPEVVSGGLAQGFATSTETRTSPRKYKMDEETGEPLSVDMRHKNEKNKTAPAKMEGEYTLILKDTEVKKMGDVKDEDYGIKIGSQLGLVEVGRGWAEYKGTKYDGKSVLERHWMTNPAEYEEFKAEVLDTLKVLRQ